MLITTHDDEIYSKIDFTGIVFNPKLIDNVKTESKFYELDAGKHWKYNSKNINSDTGNSWWILKRSGWGLSKDNVIDGGIC